METRTSVLTDDSLMPFGRHQGTPMADVPARDLLWLYENNKCSGPVKAYIMDNLQVLRKEVQENKFKR